MQEVGLTMQMPDGWQQGDPLANGGFRTSRRGSFMFTTKTSDDVWGDVIILPSEGMALADYVSDLIAETERLEKTFGGLFGALNKMTDGKAEDAKEIEQALKSRILSKQNRTINGVEFIEVVTEAQTTTISLYAVRGADVICITFYAPPPLFSKYEPIFRQSIDRIRFK